MFLNVLYKVEKNLETGPLNALSLPVPIASLSLVPPCSFIPVDACSKRTNGFIHSKKPRTISNNLSITNEAKNTFDEFIAKIDERESQLNKQGKSTEEYNVKLEEFAKSYGEKLDEVQNLIEK